MILGAGPAGTGAALTLLAAQIPVIIVERERFPRYRPGETLHPGVEPLLKKLGVAPAIDAAGYLRHSGIWSAWGGPLHYVPYGADATGPWFGLQAIRSDFDQRLLASACERGAHLIAGKAAGVLVDAGGKLVGVTTAAGRIDASVVIDCSGASRFLARQLRIPLIRHSRPLIARFGYANGEFNGASPSIRSDQCGWTWIAEVAPRRIQWTRVTEAGDRPGATWLPQCLHGLDAEPSRGADVTWWIAKSMAGPGYYLAGDCAALVDPSSSHGVMRAIMSGMMAAHLAVGSLCRGADPGRCADTYQHWLAAWLHHDMVAMRNAYRVAGLFGFGGHRVDRASESAIEAPVLVAPVPAASRWRPAVHSG